MTCLNLQEDETGKSVVQLINLLAPIQRANPVGWPIASGCSGFALPASWMNNTSLGTLDLLHVYVMHYVELMAEICG